MTERCGDKRWWSDEPIKGCYRLWGVEGTGHRPRRANRGACACISKVSVHNDFFMASALDIWSIYLRPRAIGFMTKTLGHKEEVGWVQLRKTEITVNVCVCVCSILVPRHLTGKYQTFTWVQCDTHWHQDQWCGPAVQTLSKTYAYFWNNLKSNCVVLEKKVKLSILIFTI